MTVQKSEFVALVKIISFDEYLEGEIPGHEGKMPYAMTAEIIKNYKGDKSKRTIKIFGDNGILCRPYLNDFKIDGYYLVAPYPLNSKKDEYEFLTCRTDYLSVDISTNKAYGKYSLFHKEIDLNKFENRLKWGVRNILLMGFLLGLIILILVSVLRYNKRNAH